MSFAFDRYGVRVPAVLIAPFIPPGTILRAPVGKTIDHTSIIRTLRKRFGVSAPLTRRDAVAPDLESVLSLPQPSNMGPVSVAPAPTPAAATPAALAQARLAPLNGFQQAAHDAIARLEPLPALTSGDAAGDIENIVGKLTS